MRTSALAAVITLATLSSATAIANEPPAPPTETKTSDEQCPVTVDKKATELQPTFDPPPRYPDAMLRARKEGVVRMLVLVGVDGSVLKASILNSTHSGFNNMALYTVLKWRWPPYLDEGAPACVRTEIEMTFDLR